MSIREIIAVVCGALLLGVGEPALSAEPESCGVRLDRDNLVACALAASFAVERAREGLLAAEARRTAASPLLPSNPVLELSAARRSNGNDDATNWYATLRQELEIAGQRGLRRDAAGAARDAQAQRLTLARRRVAAQAWVAYFEALAGERDRALTGKLAADARSVALAARARAEQGLISPIEADVAEAGALAVEQTRLRAERRAGESAASLRSLLGLGDARSTPAIDGELEPLPRVEAAAARFVSATLERHPALLELDAERRSRQLEADSLRRSRIPNPTLSVFVQNDGIDERVFGAGLSVPIPVPGNVGRTQRGEIAEAEALARQLALERAERRRQLLLELQTLVAAFESARREVELFAPERLARAEQALRHLREEVETGRLGIRDALAAQEALLGLLRGHLEARRAWCLASVELARALALPLEGSEP